jgi:hypothetical protein
VLFFFHSAFAQVNEDVAYLDNSYDRSIISKHRIDTVTVVFTFPDKTFKRYFIFDTTGNWIHSVTVNEKGMQTSETTLNYDKDGKLIFKHDIEGNEHDSILFYYNSSGQLIKTEKKTGNGQTFIKTFLYEKDKLLEEHRTDEIGQFVTKYKYDIMGRVIDIDEKSKNGFLHRHESIKYKSNVKIQKIHKKSFGEGIIKYSYDRKNRLTVLQNEYEKETVRYFYSEHNNLLLKKENRSTEADHPFTYTESYIYSVRKSSGG